MKIEIFFYSKGKAKDFLKFLTYRLLKIVLTNYLRRQNIQSSFGWVLKFQNWMSCTTYLGVRSPFDNFCYHQLWYKTPSAMWTEHCDYILVAKEIRLDLKIHQRLCVWPLAKYNGRNCQQLNYLYRINKLFILCDNENWISSCESFYQSDCFGEENNNK